MGFTLITFDNAPPYYALDDRVELRQLDIPSYSRPLHRTLTMTMRRLIGLRRAIQASKPDIVISFLGKINTLTIIATRGMSIPVVVSERNNPDRQIFRPAWRWARRWLYGFANRLVTPSQGVLDWFPQRLKEQGRVIPNPVELPATMEQRKPKGPTLIAVGRLEQQKGFDLLLIAYKKIADRFPEWSLTIRGEGQLRGEIEQLRDELGLQDRVKMPGITETPGAWRDEGEIFVLSSRYESFGNVLTEAMVAGLPIVSFDCPFGPSEIITDGIDGILVPPEDCDALADALEKLMLDSELRRRLGEMAQENVRRFDRSRIMNHWDQLVEDLVTV